MDDCIFCKIAAGKIPSAPLSQNSSAFLVKDINPMAPHHVLCISKDHYGSIQDPYGLDLAGLMSNMIELLQDYAAEHGLHESGYRLIINTGKDAGQTVKHLHIHLLGGAELKNDFGSK